MSERYGVLLIGAAGVFGSRLARGLARRSGYDIVIGGRHPERAQALAEELLAIDPGCGARIVQLDRDTIAPEDVRALGVAAVADAAGPFQHSSYAVPRSAVAACCHYIDLADARGFVAGIAVLDAEAKQADVAVLSGVSSTPALSHAALDRLTSGWQRIDRLLVAISPGNRAPRGRSVVRAILSYAGRPVRVFSEGDWASAPGWGLTRLVDIPGLGKREVSLCETPDLDLLVQRHRPAGEALFLAGLELPILHRGLAALSRLVRWRLVRSLAPMAPALTWIAGLFERFGSDRGGMLVEAVGLDAGGAPVRAQWWLAAAAGAGMDVPTLPARAILAALRSGSLQFRGAGPCVGLLRLDAILAEAQGLAVVTDCKLERLRGEPLFRRAAGADYDRMPAATRAVHDVFTTLVLQGEAEVEPARTRGGTLLARLLGFPQGPGRIPVRVTISADAEGESWARHFDGVRMASRLDRADSRRRSLRERFGPVSTELEIVADDHGLAMIPRSVWLGPIPLPKFCLPRVEAHESTDAQGRHLFDVSIAAPLVGRLVHYRGALTLVPAPQFKVD